MFRSFCATQILVLHISEQTKRIAVSLSLNISLFVIIRFYLKNNGSVCKKIMSCLSAASPSASTAILPTI